MTSTLRKYVLDHKEEVLQDFVATNGTKGRMYRLNNKTVSAQDYAAAWIKREKALSAVNPASLAAEFGRLVAETHGKMRTRKPKSTPDTILDKPKIFEVKLPGSGIVLMLSTRDTQTKILFEMGVES